MRAGFSFSYPPISLLLGQPLSIKRAMQERYKVSVSRETVGATGAIAANMVGILCRL
jgi:hypothetical protein